MKSKIALLWAKTKSIVNSKHKVRYWKQIQTSSITVNESNLPSQCEDEKAPKIHYQRRVESEGHKQIWEENARHTGLVTHDGPHRSYRKRCHRGRRRPASDAAENHPRGKQSAQTCRPDTSVFSRTRQQDPHDGSANPVCPARDLPTRLCRRPRPIMWHRGFGGPTSSRTQVQPCRRRQAPKN